MKQKIDFNNICTNKKVKRIVISILIAIVIEIFIFNFPAFRTFFYGNRNIIASYTLDDKTIMISGLDTKVTSIRINYRNQLTDKITYDLKYKLKNNAQIFSLKSKIILEDQKHYINFNTNANCESIQIDLITETDIQIDNIIINKCNFSFNIYRVLLLFISSIFIIKVKDKSIYEIKYNSNSKLQTHGFILNLIVFLIFVSMFVVCEYSFDEFLIKPEEFNKEDSVIMQAEAFIAGQIKLLEEPSEELKNMENPYDNVKRWEDNIPFLYDVAYYNGNYYNYFGIAPIITLILPFRLITGMYAHTYIFNLVFIIIAIFSLYALYKKLIDKYIKDISLCNFYLGFYTILFGSNILTLLRGAKYDIVVSSGIAFLLIALNLAMSIYKNKKFKVIKLILLGISSALVVLSKPNLIVYYPIILFFLYLSMKEKTTKEKIKDGVFVIIPLGVFAVFQMIYNYIRFDNILEFGAAYQLTDANMTICMSFTFGKILAGIFEYIFRLPRFVPFSFPFIFANTETSLMTINEVCYEARLVGLIAIPILWIYLFTNNILNNEKDKSLKTFIRMIIIIAMLALIIATCCGGICEAYSVDFKLFLCIGAVLLFLMLNNQNKTNEGINKLFLILTLATILIMIPISFTTESNFLINFTNSNTVFFKNIFEFWT